MTAKQTPLMQSYWDIKNQYPEELVFFQVGDFFELFFNDAQKAAAFLGITLTRRGKDALGNDIPLCGVPVHTIDHYLQKLIKGGFSVVMCEQLEQATPGKLVKRGVTRVLTPGTLTDETLLAQSKASYLLTFIPYQKNCCLLFTELMTAQLYVTECSLETLKSLETELARFFPDEILLVKESASVMFQNLFKKQGYHTSLIDTPLASDIWIQKQFKESEQSVITNHAIFKKALDALYTYFIKHNNQKALAEFTSIHFYNPEDFVALDAATLKNLEILKNNYDGTEKHTLAATLDKTATGMGSRLLKKWIVRPLLDQKVIEQRLDVVEYIKKSPRLLFDLQKLLKNSGDLERIVGRIALQKARFDDYLNLLKTLCLTPDIINLSEHTPVFFSSFALFKNTFEQLKHLLQNALNDDPAQEWLIKPGFSQELDQIRSLVLESHQALQRLEKQEQQATGITSLKIRYTTIHGYYIEITHANAALVPAHYKRQQTLVGKERYMCQELQDLQQDIIRAQNEITHKEKEIFQIVIQSVQPYKQQLRALAHVLAQLDVLTSFALSAYEYDYTRPTFNASRNIIISHGKHPVIAHALGASFVPNDGALTDAESLWIITGPNMGGKSTFLRQMALIPLMAQCGSFVPAQKADLFLLDAIFTRIGASDNLAQSKSTFLIEMEETAYICNYATKKSLIILDEIGRGTSTHDGLALAQAIVEHIHESIGARTLFATHYHELTALEGTLHGVVNYHAASKATESDITFLHTLIPGAAASSYGLAVAKRAGLPDSVIKKAHLLVRNFTNNSPKPIPQHETPQNIYPTHVFSDTVYKVLTSIDYDNLSPKKAFDILWDLKNIHEFSSSSGTK